MVKLIKVSNKIWVNPEDISYMHKNDFLEGTIIYFGNGLRITLNEEERKSLFKQMGIK